VEPIEDNRKADVTKLDKEEWKTSCDTELLSDIVEYKEQWGELLSASVTEKQLDDVV